MDWTGPNFCALQVFDVVLNGDLTIASDLDIFERVGRGVAFDEYVEFEVKDGKILYEGDESEITAGKMRVEFIKVIFTFRFFWRQKNTERILDIRDEKFWAKRSCSE